MKRTPNYGLPIVENNDRYSKEEQNSTMSIIDSELHGMSETLKNIDIEGNAEIIREIVDARNNETTLKNRLDKVDSKINEVSTSLENIALKTNDYVFINVLDNVDNYDTTLTNALNYCRSNNISKILFGSGSFNFTKQFNSELFSNLIIEGQSTTPIYNGGGGSTNLVFNNLDYGFDLGRNPYITIKNVNINCNNSKYGIKCGFFTRLENVTISGATQSGLYVELGQNSNYLDCSFSNNKNGVELKDTMTTTQTFERCFFRENTNCGVIGETSDCYFYRCTFESNLKEGVKLEIGLKLVNFDSCYWEANHMPNGNNCYLQNGKYKYSNCDFGSTQIVTVANIINSKVEFVNCEHEGDINSLPFTSDDNSNVIIENSFVSKNYPKDIRATYVENLKEIFGEVAYSAVEYPEYVDVVYKTPLDKIPVNITFGVNCAKKLTFGISNRDNRGFRIHFFDKPTDANGSIFYRAIY